MAGLISSSVNTRARLLLLLLLLLVLCSVPGFQQPIVSYIRNVARTASTTRVCARDDDDAEGSPPFGKSEMERMLRSVLESQKGMAGKMKQLQDDNKQL
jgi:hypothetical protein